MFKSALAIVLLTNVHALNLNARTQGKHDFIKAMRKSQKVNGMLPRKLSNDKLIAKSVHKPGLRSSTAQTPASTKTATESVGSVTGRKSQEPIKRQLPTKRHLNSDWWKWWKSNSDLTDEEIENMNDMDDEELQDYMEGTNSWWSWNGWGNTGNSNGTDADAEGDDMWTAGENQTYVMETLADFSVKYSGCSSLTSYVDSDEEGSYPFVNQNFVSYRLCPSESCADDSWNGCKSVYGEYLMNLEDFLTVQQDYLDEEFEYYCYYCQQCVYFDTYFTGKGQEELQCVQSCYDYDDYCSDEARKQMEEEAEFSIEDFFECKEIDIWGGDDEGDNNGDDATVVDDQFQFGDDRYNVFYKNEGKAYIGSHCNDGIITIGLFADDQCIHYVGNQIDFFNATGYELEASAVEEMYVPDGCLSCDGNNIKSSGYWFPEDEREGEEYQNEQNEDTTYISEICYNMYSQSAKCHMHYGEDSAASEALALSDSEMTSEQTTCDFIEDVVKGYVDDEGFVYSHQRENTNPIASYLAMFGADDLETEVTAAQAVGLAFTGIATAAMAFAAFQMKRKVDGNVAVGGLMANEAAVSS